MKIKKLNIRIVLVLLVTGILIVFSCKKEEENFPRTRLFQPVLNKNMTAVDNSIVVELGDMKEAQRYQVEVSRDSFVTVDYSFEVDTNYFVIDEEMVGEELLWFTLYQVRVTAIADDSEYNSLPSFLGSIRTQKFPSPMSAPTPFDVLDTQAKVYWSSSGTPVTNIKIFAGDDARLTTPLAEFSLTPEQQAENQFIVTGLEPNTTYQIAIFSDAEIRGWEVYTTRVPLISGDNVINLTGIDSIVDFSDVLTEVAEGSIILLEGGKTYLAGGYEFDKSITFMSGYSFTPALPIVDCESNFNFVDGATIDSIVFRSIEFKGEFDARYVINSNVSATIGDLRFESCYIHNLRGIFRMKDKGPGSVNNYIINDCVIDSIRDYAVLTVDRDDWQVNNIYITNSTISRVRTFLTSRNNSNSIVIDGCTFHQVPSTGSKLFRWRTAGQDNVTEGITIKNSIFGHAWDEGNTGTFGIDGFDGMANTTWIITNTYTTSQFAWGEGNDQIPGFPSFVYPGTASELWIDPYELNFQIQDQNFAGKIDAGDPRWRTDL